MFVKFERYKPQNAQARIWKDNRRDGRTNAMVKPIVDGVFALLAVIIVGLAVRKWHVIRDRHLIVSTIRIALNERKAFWIGALAGVFYMTVFMILGGKGGRIHVLFGRLIFNTNAGEMLAGILLAFLVMISMSSVCLRHAGDGHKKIGERKRDRAFRRLHGGIGRFLSLMSANLNGSGRSCRGADSNSLLARIHTIFGGSVDRRHFIYGNKHESRRGLTLKVRIALVEGAKTVGHESFLKPWKREYERSQNDMETVLKRRKI